MSHTVYLDSSYRGMTAMRKVLENELQRGRLGQYRASMEGFVFKQADQCEYYLSELVRNAILNFWLNAQKIHCSIRAVVIGFHFSAKIFSLILQLYIPCQSITFKMTHSLEKLLEKTILVWQIYYSS